MSGEKWTRYQFRWGLGQIAALLALFAGVQLQIPGAGFILGAGLLVLVMSLRPQWVGHIQVPLTRFAPKIILVVVFLDFITSAGDVLPPLMRTLTLLLTYRALEFRHPRQDRQLVLLSLLILLITGTLTSDLAFAVELFVFVPVALFLLAVAVADDRGPRFLRDWREPWRGFTWSQWWSRARGRLDRRIFVFAMALYGAFGTATMALFWSLPRFDLGYQLPFLNQSSPKSMSGFSESVAFGSVVEIKKDNSVAMRVDAPPEAAASQPYWRMMVLDEYFGRGFRQSESARGAIRSIRDIRLVDADHGAPADKDLWTHFIEGGISRQVPVPGRFGELRFTARQQVQFNSAVRSIALAEVPANMIVVRMNDVSDGAVLPCSAADQALLGVNSKSGERSLEVAGAQAGYPWTTMGLPDEPAVRQFLRQTVGRIERTASDPSEVRGFAAAATAWLRNGRGYSLQATLGDSDHPVVDWMRGSEPGHCELYAASLVLLAREAGFPARMVTGFHGGLWNGFEDYFMVRNSDAHAWVEILEPEVGWLRFDPTPGNSRLIAKDGGAAFAEVSAPMPVESSFDAYLDSLRVLWYRKVVNFDRADQEEMVASAESILERLFLGLKAGVRQSWTALTRLFRSPLDWTLYRELLPMALVVAGGGVLLWLVRRVHRRGGRKPTAENLVRRRAGRWLEQFAEVAFSAPEDHVSDYRDLLCLRYGPKSEWQTPSEVFKRVRCTLRDSARMRSSSLL